jgi:hypothetical protein
VVFGDEIREVDPNSDPDTPLFAVPDDTIDS